VRIAEQFTGNELEPIARSIDSFLERLDGFVEREQAFTATASHELRTPLAVIQGAVELLAEQHASQPEAQKPLARIQRAVREMSEFTSALLSLARESDDRHAGDVQCDAVLLLRRIVDEQRQLNPAKDIALECDAPTLPVTSPDSMVAMVIGNTVRNAIQHGVGARIECTLRARTLHVVNDGGIDANALPHIFKQRFTTCSGGHGMGLYLAQRICERYGWLLTLSSDERTTTASVTF
jgi:signal transduction histidine kinase